MVSINEDLIEDKIDKILVIDDDKDVCLVIKKILIRDNYYVEAYTDSRNALERFKSHPFDLVITDLLMPGLTGWDVALQVKENNPSIPVLLITGTPVNYSEEELLKRGINGLISKPMHLQKFLEIVAKTIGSFNK